MSLLDQKMLLKSIHPFDTLNERALEALMKQLDIAYYPKETTLINPTIKSESLYIIIKGVVKETGDDEVLNVYGERDSFDANALLNNEVKSTYIVEEDLICYELDREYFLNLIQDSDGFRDFYMQDFVSRHQRLKEKQLQDEFNPFMMAKVEEIYLHEPCFVSAKTPIITALEQMASMGAKAIIVESDNEQGIITDTNLRQNLLLGDKSKSDPIGDIATYGLITIERSDFLFNALLLFTKYGIKRLVVTENDRIVGILEQLDLLSHFASHSHLIATSIDRAQNIEELGAIERSLKQLVQSLFKNGIKIRYIAKLVSELNIKIYKKVYELTFSDEEQKNSALIIMGSEGRGEQILRSDQDNALVISNGSDVENFKKPSIAMNESLLELGFPKCSGNIMVSNSYYRKNVDEYKKAISGYIDSFSEESLMKLSIMLDAICVGGDCQLFEDMREHLFGSFNGRKDLLAHMAKAVLAFDTPMSTIGSFLFGDEKFDIKKGGVFPIMHGVRVLALEYGIKSTNTSERIKELNNRGLFDKTFATELMEAYDTLLSIRLRFALKSSDEANIISPKELSKIERDLLKDTFKVVNSFKKFLTYHYHLEMVV